MDPLKGLHLENPSISLAGIQSASGVSPIVAVGISFSQPEKISNVNTNMEIKSLTIIGYSFLDCSFNFSGRSSAG
jgi:hypothetical protein